LWALEEGNVHQVRDRLLPERPLAYTTVMTLLDRLARRGRVARRKEGRGFVYTPLVTREEMRRLAVRELTATLFEGDRGVLLAHLLGAAPAPPPAPEPDLDATLL
jgi:predicted transcriptional regulator